MAKVKKSIDLLEKNISFMLERNLYRVLRFYPLKMTVDVMVCENGMQTGIKTLPFAHLPREIKKTIKPN